MNSHQDVCAFLKSGSAFTDGTVSVDVIETHASYVFLGKSEVLKIKRPVHFSYMDFSTLEKRRKNCERELQINQAIAPEIYLGLAVITRSDDGSLEIGCKGEPVEYAVKMQRFPQKDILFELAQNNQLDDQLSAELGQLIGSYHNSLKPLTSVNEAADFERLINHLEESFASFDQPARELGTLKLIEHMRNAQTSLAPQLDLRGKSGMVRHCHGDLHLNNIVLIDGKPRPFDALEFDEKLSSIDVLYDLSFLLMDLLQLGLKQSANIVFNRYILEAWDLVSNEGTRVLPLFMALRATIRAMVTLQKSSNELHTAKHYLDFSECALKSVTPIFLVTCGLSGSGKSTLAAALAPEIDGILGAALIRSDVERKSMFGVSDYERLPPSSYDKLSSDQVYNQMFEKAEQLLKQGHPVIIDAVFLAKDERRRAEDLAVKLQVPFCGLHLEAPLPVLLERVQSRVHDASDAGPEVVKKQFTQYSEQGEFNSNKWCKVDASGTRDLTFQYSVDALKQRGLFHSET